jgi:hypothetical protein
VAALLAIARQLNTLFSMIGSGFPSLNFAGFRSICSSVEIVWTQVISKRQRFGLKNAAHLATVIFPAERWPSG